MRFLPTDLPYEFRPPRPWDWMRPLMAWHNRQLYKRVPPVISMQIRTADTYPIHSQNHFIWCDLNRYRTGMKINLPLLNPC